MIFQIIHVEHVLEDLRGAGFSEEQVWRVRCAIGRHDADDLSEAATRADTLNLFADLRDLGDRIDYLRRLAEDTQESVKQVRVDVREDAEGSLSSAVRVLAKLHVDGEYGMLIVAGLQTLILIAAIWWFR